MKRIVLTPNVLHALRALPERSVQPRLGDPSIPHVAHRMKQAGLEAASAGVVVLNHTFAYQSFFDSVNVERGILAQPIADQIVPSTLQKQETSGYGVGLYPAGESPVAVQLLLGGGKSGSPVFVLRPGEAFMTKQRFDGIRYGLPRGWLGGGTIQLRVFQNAGDEVLFPAAGGEVEVMFHRIRLPVFAVTDNPAAAGRGTSANWPLAFPWVNAFDSSNNPQGGRPQLVVTPSKIILRLRKAAMAAMARMRLLILKSDDLDLQSDGATFDAINASGSWVDFTWPVIAASGFQIGGVATTEFPTVTIESNVSKIGGPSAICVLLDMDGTIVNTVKVDIERWGDL